MKQKYIWMYVVYLLLAWGSFRYWVSLPDAIEELWFKPLIWLVPLFWWKILLKGNPKMFEGSLIKAVLWGLVVSLFYFGLISSLRGWQNVQISWVVVFVSIATVITEELALSGFVLGYLDGFDKNKVKNLLMVAVMTMVLRVPIVLLVYKLEGLVFWGMLVMAGSVALVNGWLRQKTDNVISSMVARLGMTLAMLG